MKKKKEERERIEKIEGKKRVGNRGNGGRKWGERKEVGKGKEEGRVGGRKKKTADED